MTNDVRRRAVLRWAIAPVTAVMLAACGSSSSSSASNASGTTGPANPDVILATTTSTQDSGLLDALIPAFEKSTGYKVKTVAVGTGAALKMGQQGNADVLMVHAPSQEETFMAGGYGVDRRLAAHNYFLIVGPKSDPAKIATATTAAEAFKRIATAKATFISRGDGSGTETKEKGIWKKAGIAPSGSWYLKSGQGMGATLQITSQKQGYTITDDSTFLANAPVLQLASLVKGDPFLLNVYHVIAVNAAKWPKVNAAGAKAFEDYVTSTAGQSLIADFGKDKTGGEPLFVADFGKNEADLK